MLPTRPRWLPLVTLVVRLVSEPMKPAGTIIVLAFVFLMSGCGRHAAVPDSGRSALHRIASVDVNLDDYPSYSQYHDRVSGQIKAAMHQVSSAPELKTLFLECHRRWRAAPEAPQERLQWIEPHAEACNAILSRLAELDSEEAASVLVDLYADEAIGWDGEFALNGAHAISRCGKRAIPYLAKTSFGHRGAHIQDVVHCIEKGELYGP